jgi:chromosome partitioning protein
VSFGESAAAGVSRETSASATSDTPLGDQAALDAARRLRLRDRRLPRPASTRVIAVANQKGGVGKTSTAVNLASALAAGEQRVLVVDIDPQGNASTALGVDHHGGAASIYDVLLRGTPLAQVLVASPNQDGLWCAPATIDLSGAEVELVNEPKREYRLHEAIGDLRRHLRRLGEPPLDYVIVDCPPSLGLLTLNALVGAKEVLIPIQCEYYALEGLSQLLRTIGLVRDSLNSELAVSAILLTMYDARTNLAHDVVREVKQHFPTEVMRTTIPRSVRIAEAPGFGQTVIAYDPNSTGALAYREAALELAERTGGDRG